MRILRLLAMALLISCFFVGEGIAQMRIQWNGKEINGWVCDGKTLKPKFGANGQNTWIFDGREIKPKFGATGSNTWVYDGREVKPKFGANSSNTWILDGSRFKPKFGANSSNTWDVGNAPILVIVGKAVLRLY